MFTTAWRIRSEFDFGNRSSIYIHVLCLCATTITHFKILRACQKVVEKTIACTSKKIEVSFVHKILPKKGVWFGQSISDVQRFVLIIQLYYRHRAIDLLKNEGPTKNWALLTPLSNL